MQEFVTEFVNLQRYVPYLRVEKAKVYSFISCLPLVYKKKDCVLNYSTMDEAIRKT